MTGPAGYAARRDQGLREHQRHARRWPRSAPRDPAADPDLPPSPIFWLIPLIAVAVRRADGARARLRLSPRLGVTINGQSSSILSVLVLGAGTDYALLLVSRYREELRKHEDKHDALRQRAATAGPGDLRLRPDGRRRAADAVDRRGQRHLGHGPDRRDGHRRRDARDADAAARAAGHHRPLGVLAPADVSAGATACRTSATRARTRPTARGGGSASGSRAPRAGSGSPPPRSCRLLLRDPRTSRHGLNGGNQYVGEVESVDGQALLAKAYPSGDAIPTDIVVPDASKGRGGRGGGGRGRPRAAVAARGAGRGRRAARRHARRRPVLQAGRGGDRPDPRGRARGGRRGRAGRRPDRDPARRARGRDPRHAADRPDRAGDRVPDPDGAPAGGARAAAADRDGDPVLRRGARRRASSSTT